MTLHEVLQSIAKSLGVQYQCYRVLRFDLRDQTAQAGSPPPGLQFEAVDESAVRASPDPEIRDSATFAGPDAMAFALRQGSRIVCLQWYWVDARLRDNEFWTVGSRTAASEHLVTVVDCRSRGYATALKQLTAAHMRNLGYETLLSRVWWSNCASLRVSAKAGWQRVGTSLSLSVPWRSRPMEWRWAARP